MKYHLDGCFVYSDYILFIFVIIDSLRRVELLHPAIHYQLVNSMVAVIGIWSVASMNVLADMITFLASVPEPINRKCLLYFQTWQIVQNGNVSYAFVLAAKRFECIILCCATYWNNAQK